MTTKVFLLLHGVATVSAFTLIPSDVETLLPAASLTGESDSWECATHDYSKLLDLPRPTGSLEDALQSYNKDVFGELCTATGIDRLDCPPAGYPEVCGFDTAAPNDVLSAYSSHASSASSWWAAHSSSALSIASECPHYWYEAARETFLAAPWLNQTIAYAQCHDDAGITGVEPTETGPTATSGAGLAEDMPEETGEPDSGVGHFGTASMLMVAASGLAAAVMNAL